MRGAPLTYDCVICTRNRPAALRLSIPRLVAQTRPPERIIVVDASDDEAAVVEAIADVSRAAPVQIDLIRAARGLTVQRNIGLKMVTAPVVFLPDDDSHCDPDYGERIMAIYERDSERRVGAVVGTQRARPLDAVENGPASRLTLGNRLRQLLTAPRTRIEKRLVRDPLASISWELKAAWELPDWLSELDASPTCWVRGFRMTFRTDALRDIGGFDETLREYAAFEDTHAGLAIGERYVVVQAAKAQVFHHQAAGGRGSGRVRGATNLANRALVVAKHSAPRSRHRREMARYAVYRCCLYALGSLWSDYHRESLRGALAVLRRFRPLLTAESSAAEAHYWRALAGAGVDVT